MKTLTLILATVVAVGSACNQSIDAVESALVGNPPTPTGPHPRLFLNASTLAALTAKAMTPGTAANKLATGCQNTIDNPQFFVTRGGADGNTWPAAAQSCAFGYLTLHNPVFLTQAIKYWNASLSDDQNLGDNLGCTATANPAWQSWDHSLGTAAPPVILTVTHDTDYPIRWYGPMVTLTYDWLHDAPGVDDALRSHTRFCLKNWVDYYTAKGYHNKEAGSNYNAGYVVSKAYVAVAIGGEEGVDSDRIWTETLTDVFQNLLIAKGLATAPPGVMLGGDWGEGWQYGPMSVLEYALAARVLEENGASLPEMDAWANSLIVRYIHSTVPHLDGEYVGGDFEAQTVYAVPQPPVLDAVIAGTTSPTAKAWAQSFRTAQGLGVLNQPSFADVLAEIDTTAPVNYVTPSTPLWYLAKGTRTLYGRSDWTTGAFWTAFQSAPHINSDHQHVDASNFVFTRGGDHLIVDTSTYGSRSTQPTNALSADSAGVAGIYATSQTPWSAAELLWARVSAPAVYAARADIAKAFNFTDIHPSDIPYAHREWVFLPEGEIVTIDRIRTGDPTRVMYVNFHANTKGTMVLANGVALGTVGSSQVAITPVLLSGGVPSIMQPLVGEDCAVGTCTKVRFAVDEYAVRVPGPYAVAVHVIDGLAMGETPATVGSLNSPAYDPNTKNAGIIGAAVFRSTKQSFVVASSAQDGLAGATMVYSTPGSSTARHVVFDAPENASGQSTVTTSVSGTQCVVTLTAGAGFAGHPLMFQISTAASGCAATESTDVPAGVPPPGGGTGGAAGSPGGAGGVMGTGGAPMGTGGAVAGMGGVAGGASGMGGASGQAGGMAGGVAGSAGGSSTNSCGGQGGYGGYAGSGTPGTGCGCSLPGDASSGGLGVALAAVALVLSRRRRSIT